MLNMTRRVLLMMAVLGLVRGSALAQTSKGYAEVVAQSAFGNVTSQAYGGELGYSVWRNVQIFAEAGQIRNVATKELSASAQAIAGALTQLQSAAVSYSVKQPVTLFAVGVRVAVPGAKVQPYVLGGFGAAQIKNDVSFQLGGSDASSSLSQFVTLGDDLSGKQTRPTVTFGAGAVWPAYKQLIVDFQFRFGRILLEAGGINVGRAGIGLGVRF
jgi:opacity protein-like surface antigen